MHKYLLILLLALTSHSVVSKEYMLFFLGGQSNMDGYGYNSELPNELVKEQNVMIFHGNGVLDNQKNGGIGLWTKMKPGHGTGFKNDGNKNFYTDRFGAELTFAAQLTAAFPNKNIAIIKYSVGGTGIHINTGFGNWSPDFRQGQGLNQYDFALNTINNAYSDRDIDNDGKPDRLIPAGIIWMQGEADAHTSSESAKAYLHNLTRLMSLLRAALRKDDIPIVIGKITDSQLGEEDIMPYIKIVHQAQQAFVEQDICAAYMTNTQNYAYSAKDPWHYLTPGYIAMGKDFANSYISLSKKCN
ncbi:sialate O-acetylesterase [Catenovulum sp. SX2]|uniref:sialate O-acetylesterase n=1 Tax=Catenovulum sp. SX2 TaxID=3398614 RepID=UPI003F8418E8